MWLRRQLPRNNAYAPGYNLRHGRASVQIIAADDAMLYPQLYLRAFDSLICAYHAAGLPRLLIHVFAETRSRLYALRARMQLDVWKLVREAGLKSEMAPLPGYLLIDGSIVCLAVKARQNPTRGAKHWRAAGAPSVDFTIAAWLESASATITDYFLLNPAAVPCRLTCLIASNLKRYTTNKYLILHEMFGHVGTPSDEASC